MQNTDEKPLKVFVNTNNVLEIYNIYISTNKCFSFKGFKEELQNKIHELQSKDFTVRWKNADGVELEIACDEDFEEVLTSLQSCFVCFTTAAVQNEVSSSLQSEEGGLKDQFFNWFGNSVGIKSNICEQYFRTCEGLAQLQQMGFQDNSTHLMNLLDRYQGNVMAVANTLRI